MIIISTEGDYEFITGTKTVKTSDHPVYQAQIETNLALKKWIGAPNSIQPLAKFNRSKQSVIKVDEFRKELGFYLQKYNPDVQDAVIDRIKTIFNLRIEEDAFNG